MTTRIWIIAILAITVQSCVDEDYFGLSPYGEIRSIEVSNQASQALINGTDKTVLIEFPPGVDISQSVIQALNLSSFATADRQVGDTLDLRESVNIHVTAEDLMTVTTWQLIPKLASAQPQLSNNDFNAWYEASDGYFEPGLDAGTTIWGTGNPGTKILNLFPTTPLEITNGNYSARMETLFNGPLAAAFGTPISAGSIYTGKFDPDKIEVSNPQAAINFGTPFSGRPTAFALDYTYSPGEENKDKSGNALPYGDACDIYLLLELRNGTDVRRLATGWFRSDQEQTDVSRLNIEMEYGPLSSNAPDYAKPPNGKYVSADSAAFVLPTHAVFVASSSFGGNDFAGAVGSLLVIDNLEFIYD